MTREVLRDSCPLAGSGPGYWREQTNARATTITRASWWRDGLHPTHRKCSMDGAPEDCWPAKTEPQSRWRLDGGGDFNFVFFKPGLVGLDYGESGTEAHVFIGDGSGTGTDAVDEGAGGCGRGVFGGGDLDLFAG